MPRLVSKKSAMLNKGADLANQLIMNNVVVRRGIKEALKSGGRAVPMDLMAAYAAFTANLVAEKDLQRKLQSIEKEEKIRMREIHTERLALQQEFEEQEDKYWGCPRVFSAESFFSDSDTYRREVYTGPVPTKAKMGRKKLDNLRDLLRLLASEDDIPLGLKRPRSTGKNVTFRARAEAPGEPRPSSTDAPDDTPAPDATGHARPERIKSAPATKQAAADARGVQLLRARSAWTERTSGLKKQRTMSLQPEILHKMGGEAERTDDRRVCSAQRKNQPGITRESTVEETVGLAEETNTASGGVCGKKDENDLGSIDMKYGSKTAQALAPNRKYTRRASAPVRGSANVTRQTEAQVARLYSSRRHTFHSSEIPKYPSQPVGKSGKLSARPASARETILARHGELILGRESPVGPQPGHRGSPDVSRSETPDSASHAQVETEECDSVLSSSEKLSTARMETDSKRELDLSNMKATDAIKPAPKIEIQVKSQRHRKGSQVRSKLVHAAARKGSASQNMAPTELRSGPRDASDARRASAPPSVILTRTAAKALSCQAKPLAPRTCERWLHQSQPERESPRPRRASIFRRKSLSASLYGEQIQVETNLRQKVHAFLETQVEHLEEEHGREELDEKQNEPKPANES